ncbi:PREDICTED: major facilitator superfamily domain-containing protein 6 [Ceratosolen solmsi marchali]|uniref:Major facilitator superfamily domain-containing protein 6 n=1 Tax=Ceratosolen solmsi marchali TaxID=326594 RepID=A0AAJ6YDB4_9HYME|nr:PREDICTED: major facilitator superfamily domain-containing protein 6 [Ceratosolen solmsi marchali]
MFGHINRNLVPIKAHYFLYYGATGPIMQFLPTIAKQLGFSGLLVGTIYTILPISGLIAKPLFGALADKFKLHKIFFIAFQIFLTVAFFTINFIPQNENSAKTVLTCDKYTFLELCSEKPFSDLNSSKIQSTVTDNVNCHLSCTVISVKDFKAFCDSWHIHEYCFLIEKFTLEQIKHFGTIEFEAQFNESYNLPLANCLNIRVFNASFANEDVHKADCAKTSFRIECRMWCPKVPFLNNLIKEINSIENPRSKQISWNFKWFLWVSITSWIGMAVVVSIGDAICLDLLGDEKNKDYGKQKMWGSIGFGIFGIGTGYLTDLFSKGDEIKDYTCIFYIMLIAMIFDILISTTLKKNCLRDTNEPSVLWELCSIGKEGRVLAFAWWCIGAGMCTGVIWNFLFWYTEDISSNNTQKEWLKTLQGLLTGTQCFLGEMPFNFISGSVIRKVGHINVMSLVLLTYSIRFMAYSMFSNAWIFLILEFLHGPSFGLCWPTMVSYGDKVAPPGTKATIQGLVGAVFEGIGVSSGSLLCGYLMDNYKGVVTFRIFSIGALIWLSIFWIWQLLLRKAKAYPLQQGHTHLTSYVSPNDDTVFMAMSQEMQTY